VYISQFQTGVLHTYGTGIVFIIHSVVVHKFAKFPTVVIITLTLSIAAYINLHSSTFCPDQDPDLLICRVDAEALDGEAEVRDPHQVFLVALEQLEDLLQLGQPLRRQVGQLLLRTGFQDFDLAL
jgi:hypothetical protein